MLRQAFFYFIFADMAGISAVIITYNEERNIARCLTSLQGLVDEIVVVDSFSNDHTVEICREFGARIIQNPFSGHIQQKNFALDQAKNDYVLSLDADEEVSASLAKSILQVKNNPQAQGYSMNRLSNYCGKWIHHGSWYPDRKLRLFDRRVVRWGGENPHDKAIPASGARVEHLSGDIHHYSYYTLDEHIRKLDYFSGIAAQSLFQKGRSAGLVKIVFRPGLAFVRDYVLRGGFLDGYEGFLIARLTAWYTFQKYVKLHFYLRSQKITLKGD